MNKPLSLKECLDHLDMLGDETVLYLERSTGKLYPIGEYERSEAEALEDEDLDALSKEGRDLLRVVQQADESDDFKLLLDKFEIHDWDIMRKFVNSVANDDLHEELTDAIHGAGAFRMFRAAIRRLGLKTDWYRFKDDALARLVIDWCEADGIDFVDDRDRTASDS